MALKKCVKVHKLFLAEVERCDRLEKEGKQVLSSLANVSQRLPLLQQEDNAALGILTYSAHTQALLLQKHFASLEKSVTFLTEILQEYQDITRRMKMFVHEMNEMLDTLDPLENENDIVIVMQWLEWMENVLVMYEHEAIRKKVLVGEVEYHDHGRLSLLHKQWSADNISSNINHDYVQQGMESLPLIPKSATPTADAQGDSKVTKKKKKKKK